MKLELDAISKSYGNFRALSSVSATLEDGIYGLLGPNGAGKTTLINILIGILPSSGGTIRLDGNDTARMGRGYFDLIGYMPQYSQFYANFTVLEFLYYMCQLKGVKNAKSRIEEVLAFVNLCDWRQMRIGALSGGMRQRLGVAQAILNNPKLLVLDEPTAGLDPEERVRFRGLLSRYAREGRTVLLSTHIVEDIHQLCEELAVLRKGHLFYAGTSAALLERVKDKVKILHLENENQLIELQKKSVVLSTTYESHGLTARIMDESGLFSQATPVTATLEDAYVYCMGGKAHA